MSAANKIGVLVLLILAAAFAVVGAVVWLIARHNMALGLTH